MIPVKHQATAVLLAAILAAPAIARENTNWDYLRMLRSGQRIGVVQSDQTRTEGVFGGFSESGISVRTDRVIIVPKEQVMRVYRRPRLSRTLRAVLGAGIGVAVGAVLNRTIGQYLRNEAHDTSEAGWIGAGAAVGAGIGAVSG